MVVTDMKMPGKVSGTDLCRWIEQHRPELTGRVIFTTSDAGEKEVRLELEKSGCPWVQKPFRIEELLEAVRGVLARDSTALKR